MTTSEQDPPREEVDSEESRVNRWRFDQFEPWASVSSRPACWFPPTPTSTSRARSLRQGVRSTSRSRSSPSCHCPCAGDEDLAHGTDLADHDEGASSQQFPVAGLRTGPESRPDEPAIATRSQAVRSSVVRPRALQAERRAARPDGEDLPSIAVELHVVIVALGTGPHARTGGAETRAPNAGLVSAGLVTAGFVTFGLFTSASSPPACSRRASSAPTSPPSRRA